MRFCQLFLILYVGCWPCGTSAQSPSPRIGPADLYFLAVGTGKYRDSDLGSFSAGKHSAELVARSLISAGARHGIVLTGSPERDTYVTRQDVLGALTRLKQRIRKDGPAAPRVFIYMLMHGVADSTSGYLFMIPENLVIRPKPVPQESSFRLAKNSAWNIDILAALTSFRMDKRLNHFDDFAYSSLFSDKLGMLGLPEHFRNFHRYFTELDERKRSYGSKPFDNAPVPFVVLFDNCTNGFEYNLFEPNEYFKMLAALIFDGTLDSGRAFYSTKPGRVAGILELPEAFALEEDLIHGINGRQVRPNVGPLAIHLKRVLMARNSDEPMTFASFSSAILEGVYRNSSFSPERPYMIPSELRQDVAAVELFPRRSEELGTVDRVHGTGLGDI